MGKVVKPNTALIVLKGHYGTLAFRVTIIIRLSIALATKKDMYRKVLVFLDVFFYSKF